MGKLDTKSATAQTLSPPPSAGAGGAGVAVSAAAQAAQSAVAAGVAAAEVIEQLKNTIGTCDWGELCVCVCVCVMGGDVRGCEVMCDVM